MKRIIDCFNSINFISLTQFIVWYLRNILLLIDIGMNTVILGGSPYETISSRVGKYADKGELWAIRAQWVLDHALGAHHCKNSEVPDYGSTLPWLVARIIDCFLFIVFVIAVTIKALSNIDTIMPLINYLR
jgi:hypothetical protein